MEREKVKVLRPTPPVEKRPKCPGCGEPLRPRINRETARRTEQRQRPDEFRPGEMETYSQVVTYTVSTEWDGTYHGYGHFCTLSCACRWANNAVEKGVVLKRVQR